MQKGSRLQFCCQNCKESVHFGIFELESSRTLSCEHCDKKYAFTDEVLLRQIKKFDALCRQIRESEEILSDTAVGVDIGPHHVQIPYKILLTRLSSSLNLTIGDSPLSIIFRIEPGKDLSLP